MKKIIFMFCCFIATSCLFTGCEETEVKKSSEKFDYQRALKLLDEQFPEANSENQNARTQAVRDLDCILTSAYEQGSTFSLSARIDLNSVDDGNCPGGTFSIKWYYYNENTEIWKVWTTKTGTCLSHGNTTGTYAVTTKTTPLWFFARVSNSNQPGELWGEGFSNRVVLNRPF